MYVYSHPDRMVFSRHWSHFMNMHQVMSDSQFNCAKNVCVLTPRPYGLLTSLITLHEHAPSNVRQSIELCQECTCTHTQTVWSSHVTDHTSWTCTKWCQTVNLTVPRMYVYSHPDRMVFSRHWSHFMNMHQVMSDSQLNCAKNVRVLTPRPYGLLTSLITLHEHAPSNVRQSI